jgi:hypothetical protein
MGGMSDLFLCEFCFEYLVAEGARCDAQKYTVYSNINQEIVCNLSEGGGVEE